MLQMKILLSFSQKQSFMVYLVLKLKVQNTPVITKEIFQISHLTEILLLFALHFLMYLQVVMISQKVHVLLNVVLI